MSPLLLTFTLTLLIDITWTAPRMVFSLYALALGARAVRDRHPLRGAQPVPAAPVVADRQAFRPDRPAPPLALAIGASAAGLVIPYLVHSMAALYAGSALVGLAFAFFLVNVQNLVGVLSAPEKRAANFTTFSLLGATSNLIGPLIGGFSIDHWGHAVACLNIVALSVVAAVLFAAWGRGLPGGARRKAGGFASDARSTCPIAPSGRCSSPAASCGWARISSSSTSRSTATRSGCRPRRWVRCWPCWPSPSSSCGSCCRASSGAWARRPCSFIRSTAPRPASCSSRSRATRCCWESLASCSVWAWASASRSPRYFCSTVRPTDARAKHWDCG